MHASQIINRIIQKNKILFGYLEIVKEYSEYV